MGSVGGERRGEVGRGGVGTNRAGEEGVRMEKGSGGSSGEKGGEDCRARLLPVCLLLLCVYVLGVLYACSDGSARTSGREERAGGRRGRGAQES